MSVGQGEEFDKGPTRKSSALERYRVLERISWVDNVNWLL